MKNWTNINELYNFSLFDEMDDDFNDWDFLILWKQCVSWKICITKETSVFQTSKAPWDQIRPGKDPFPVKGGPVGFTLQSVRSSSTWYQMPNCHSLLSSVGTLSEKTQNYLKRLLNSPSLSLSHYYVGPSFLYILQPKQHIAKDWMWEQIEEPSYLLSS